MGKVSTQAHFLLEPGCDDYSFLDQAVIVFEHGLDSSLTDSVITPELDASFGEAVATPSLVCSGVLSMFRTHSDHSKLQLVLSIKYWNYSAMLWHYFYLYHWWVKCQPLR